MTFRQLSRHVWLCFAIAICAASALLGETDFCIAGLALNSVTGEPLRRALVTIPDSAALSDASGSFRFCHLAPGDYSVSAVKPGFEPEGLRLTIGPSRENLALRLKPQGVLTGRVEDSAGEPIEGVRIQLLSIHPVEGRRSVAVETSAATDDRGQYRLAGLTGGKYYVRMGGWDSAPPKSETDGFAPAYYGGAEDLESAATLTVEPGREIRADFSVKLSRRIGFAAPSPAFLRRFQQNCNC